MLSREGVEELGGELCWVPCASAGESPSHVLTALPDHALTAQPLPALGSPGS